MIDYYPLNDIECIFYTVKCFLATKLVVNIKVTSTTLSKLLFKKNNMIDKYRRN